MGILGFTCRAQFRARWRSWLAMTLLISMVGGFVLAAAAAGRRTENAFPAFVAAHGYDTIVYATRPAPEVAHLQGVASATEMIIPDTGTPRCPGCRTLDTSGFGVAVTPAAGRAPFKLISGRLPDPSAPNQVLASFTLEQSAGVHVGSVVRVPFEAPDQGAAYNDPNVGLPRPHGPTMAFHVVGIEASEFEFPSGGTTVYLLYTDRAFAQKVLPRTAFDYQYLVRLSHGAAGLGRFKVSGLDLGAGTTGASNQDGLAASVEMSIHPQAIGWWILAALAGLVGAAVIGQALSRQTAVESAEYPILKALGADRRQLTAQAMVRTAAVGAAGATGAVLVAAALSPLAPLGEARTAEVSTGVPFDALVLLTGALAVAVVVVALGVWPAVKAARAGRGGGAPVVIHPSTTVRRLTAAGAPPSAVIGVSNALERRTGGATVPLGSALLGVVLAVVTLCGTGVFGASLTRLTATPRLWGEPEQLNFQPPSTALLDSLEHNPAVAGITFGIGAGEITINHRTVGAIAASAVRGPLLFSAVEGSLPRGDDQIGLGATTMRQVGAHIGSVVAVTVTMHSGRSRTLPYRVVSQDSFPEMGGIVSLGSGALFTTSGLLHALCPSGPQQARCRAKVSQGGGGAIRVIFVSGDRGQAAIHHYLDAYPSIATVPVTPTSLVNFGEAVNFPLIFGVMLAVFGAATLTHLLVVSVARRRREVGLLKVLGFVNVQVIASVAWQATTLALVGVVIGLPLGVIIGRAVWNLFAGYLGVVPSAAVPLWFIGSLAMGVVLAANLLAVAPALAATRVKPARLLGPA